MKKIEKPPIMWKQHTQDFNYDYQLKFFPYWTCRSSENWKVMHFCEANVFTQGQIINYLQFFSVSKKNGKQEVTCKTYFSFNIWRAKSSMGLFERVNTAQGNAKKSFFNFAFAKLYRWKEFRHWEKQIQESKFWGHGDNHVAIAQTCFTNNFKIGQSSYTNRFLVDFF